jgi:1-acylglycerone phosphate reductase
MFKLCRIVAIADCLVPGYTMPLLDTEVSVAKKMFDVNVFALVSVTQAFAPLLIASKGTVINIGSVLGHTPIP